MEKILSIILVVLGISIFVVYGLLFFGKHGVLTGTDDEKEGEEDVKEIHTK